MTSSQIAALMDKVNILKDEQEKVQKKTFTKWINSYLCQLDPPKMVKDLMTDFKDGLLLLDLLGLLTKTTLKKEQPRNMQRIHCLTNVKTALEFMIKEKNIKMVNINPSDVVDGKPAIVLGLVWTSILHFQIEEQEEFLLQALGLENDAKLKGQARKGLIAWANNALSDKYGLPIKDLGDCWRDGKAFNALVHNIDPSLIDMAEMEKQTVRERLQNAFIVAESELGIPRLLDVEDVDVENPDEKSIMTYVGQFLKSFPEGRRPEDERKVKPPPSDLDIINAFNVKVEYNFDDPKLKNDYDVFAELMNQKDDIQNKLDKLSTGADPSVDSNQLDRAKDEFYRNNDKLNEWKWNFDKKLPGKMGSEIGPWLKSAEKILMAPFPEIDDKNFSKNIADRLREHEKIFNNKNMILAQFNDLKRNLASNIPLKQLDNLQKRLEYVMENEAKIREQLNLFALQDELKNKSKKWNKDLDSWNTPLASQKDLNDRVKALQAHSNNGDSMEKYANDLSDLIKRKAKFCKENPDFDPKLLDFLNQSIVECEEENDVLPEKFESSKNKLESLSNTWNDIADSEKKIETFLNKLKKSMQSNDLEEQKKLADQLPDMAELLENMKEKVREDLAPYSSRDVIQALEKKIASFDRDMQSNGEDVINQIELQEQEIARQQQAAQEQLINSLVSSNEADLKDITDWINALEGCVGPTIKGSSGELQNTLKTLESLNKSAPEIQNLLKQGYQTVEELRRQNEPEKANQIKKTLDELQKTFTNYKDKEIPKSMNNLKSMIDTVKATEKGIEELNKFMEEGDLIKKYLEDPKLADDSSDIINKEKRFLAKGRDITDSIKRERDLLNKLKEMSKNGNLNIDLSPLEKKIASSEKALQEILQKAEDNVTATNKCEEACKNATQFIDNLSTKIRKDGLFANDEDGQKAKMKNIENMTKDLENAEELIKVALAQRNSAVSHLTKPEIEKIDNKIAKMKANAADLKSNLEKSKKELSSNLDDWGKYKKSKESVVKDFEATIKDLEKSHQDHNGIHGRDSDDKAAILKDNQKRLNDMKKQEKEIDNLLEMAKKLGSEKPLAEIQNLKKKHQKQREDLEKEIEQNAKELENHKKLDSDMNEFKDWLKETEKLSKKIESLPNTKEGLIEKQKCLAQLENMKAPGEKKLKDLKNLMRTVLNETNPNEKSKLSGNIEGEIDRYNKIFVNLDQQDGINETIKKLDSIGEKSLSLLENIDDIHEKLEKCMDLPSDTVDQKEDRAKDLKNLKSQLDQQKAQIKELKKQCGSLDKSAAADDLKSKIDQLEKQCSKMEKEVNEKIQENEHELEQQMEMEKKLNEFTDLMNETEDEIYNSLPPGTSEAAIEENLKKLQKIKAKYSPGKKLLENIIRATKGFNAPKKCMDECKISEDKYFNLSDEITNLETKLATEKDNWSKFNSKKAEIDKGLNVISDQIAQSHDFHKGIHGGDCADKAMLLETNKKRLADLNKEEEEIDKLLKMAEKLNSDKPLSEVQNLKKKFQKQRQELENTIQENEEDLEKHKNYQKEFEKFIDENKSIIKDVQEELSKLPNTKEGLQRKLELFDNLKQMYNQRKKILVNLESMKNDVMDHSSSNSFQSLEQQWDQVVDLFEKSFNPPGDHQAKLLETVQQIEKTEAACDELQDKLTDLEERQNAIMNQPVSSVADIESKIKSMKALRQDLKDLLTPFNEINRKQSQIPNEVESVKQKVEQLLSQYKTLCDSSSTNLNECEDHHRQLSNISAGINNFKSWLDHTANQIEEQGTIKTLELGSLKKGLNSLKILRDDIAEHKVDLSRLQTSIDAFMKISNDISLQNSFDELADMYNKIFDLCQNEAEKNDLLIRLMNKYENSRSNVLHWIETNTQILLKCSDYTLNPSQIKSKLIMIENLERDLEGNGQMKFVEAIQDGEELMRELSGQPLQLVAQQNADLKADWLEISRQLNQLSNNLKNATARYEAFKEISNRLSSWLDDMEHTGLLDPSSIEHNCEIPSDDKGKNKSDRMKTLLIEVDRHKPEFNQLANMATELANPSFTMENSQIQNRFNRLQSNLKDKIEKLNKQQADYEKIKQNIEDMEKWIFQTSIKIINENAEQGSNSGNQDIDDLIQNSNDIIKSIMAKEPEMSKIHQTFESILSHTDSQSLERQRELQEDLKKLEQNYNNLKETAIHKRDHLVNNVKQWENYQKLLQTTKDFLDNDLARWWKDKVQNKGTSALSNRDHEFQFHDIVDMENKLNGLKKSLETAAKECDGILPTITSALQRSQNPIFKTNRSSSFTATNLWTKGDSDPTKSIPNLLSNCVYEDLENNLKRLAALRKDHQDRTVDWNNFNREKNSFKNWLDNELMKLSSALQASPTDTSMDLFHRNKLKEIQEEINLKRPVLENLNSRYQDLTAKTPGSVDAILKEITREFEKAEKQVNKILNREDKQVECNFSDEDEDLKVPKLNLGILRNGYESPDNLSRYSQTARDETDNKRGSKMTQTKFKELTNYGTQTPRKPRVKHVCKILDSLKGINDRLERSDYSPKSTLSAKPRSPNQESIRRNLISSHPHLYPTIKPTVTPTRFENGLKAQRSLSSRPFSHSLNRPLSLYPKSPLSNSINDNLEYYVPTKDKWLNLDVNNSYDVPPSRQFEVDYSSTMDGRPSKSRNRIDSGRRSASSKTSRIKESLNKIHQDANELRDLSEKLRHY